MVRSNAQRLFLINPAMENSVTVAINSEEDTADSSQTSCDSEGTYQQPGCSKWGLDEISTSTTKNNNDDDAISQDFYIEPDTTDSESGHDKVAAVKEESCSEISCEIIEATTSACSLKRSFEDEPHSVKKYCAVKTLGTAKQKKTSSKLCDKKVFKSKGRPAKSGNKKAGSSSCKQGLREDSDKKLPVATKRRNVRKQGSVNSKSERQMRGYHQRIEDIDCQLNWISAVTHENCLETLKKKRALLQIQMPSLKLNVKTVLDSINELTDRLSSIEMRIKDLHAGNSSRVEYDTARSKLTNLGNQYRSKLTEIRDLDVRITCQEPLLVLLTDQLAKLRKQEARFAQLTSKEQLYKELKNTYDEMSRNHSDVHLLGYTYKSDLAEAITRVEDTSNRIQVLQQELAVFQGNSFLSEEQTALIQEEIDNAQRNSKFQKTPLGPIEKYVAVRDENWSSAVNVYLADLLQCYCVDNPADRKVLHLIFTKVLGTGPKPDIIVSEYLSRRHDVSEHQVHPPQQGMCSMLDMLSTENPIILNCLIDQLEVERMLLVPTNEEARQLMRDADTVPVNIKAAITPRGTQFYPLNVPHTSRADVYDEIRALEEQIESCEQLKISSELQVTQLTKAVQENSAELTRIQTERNGVEQAIFDTRDIIFKLKSSCPEQPSKQPEDDYNVELNIMNSFKKAKEDLVAECHILVDTIIETKKIVTALRETLYVDDDKEALLAERKILRNQLKMLKRKKNRRLLLLHNVEGEIISTANSIRLQQHVTEQACKLIKRGYRYRHPKRNTKEEKIKNLLQEKIALEETISNNT